MWTHWTGCSLVFVALSLPTCKPASDTGPSEQAATAPRSAVATSASTVAMAPASASAAERAMDPASVLAGDHPFEGKPLAGVSLGEEVTKLNLRVRVPAGWEVRLGRAGDKSYGVNKLPQASVVVGATHRSMGDASKNKTIWATETQSWLGSMAKKQLGEQQATKLGNLAAQTRRGAGSKIMGGPGCMDPKAPPRCRQDVHLFTFGVSGERTGYIINCTLAQDADAQTQREFLSVLRSVRVET